MRLAAAVAVLISHSFPIAYGSVGVQPLTVLSRDQTNLGSLAVLVFFVISGYLVTRSFDRLPAPHRFVAARALRVIPGLAVALVLSAYGLGAAVTTLPLGGYLADPATARYVLDGLSLAWMRYSLPGVFESNPAGLVVNGSLWTLEYEVLMYLAVLALGTAHLLRRRAVLLLWLGAMILSWRGKGALYTAFGTPFLSGAMLYLWRDRIPLDGRLALASVAALGATMATGGFRLAFATAGAYLVVFLAISPAVRLPDLARQGDLSYGVYVYAWPVQQTAAFLLGPAATWYRVTAVALPVALALAWLSWHLVERPALRLKRRTARAAAG